MIRIKKESRKMRNKNIKEDVPGGPVYPLRSVVE